MTSGPRNMGERPTPEQISELAEAHFGKPVKRITAPGGRTRDSVRVHFSDESVIASYRARPERRARESLVLERLYEAGASVPQYLGNAGGLLFQSDLGGGRLGAQMGARDRAGQVQLARSAFDSLWQIKTAARDRGLTAELPAVASSARWVSGFATDARKLAQALEIAPPDADYAALSKAMVPVPRHFVKWDARSGNAAVQADGRVAWFDWEHAGCRHGIEDFGFLIADEFWPLPVQDTLEAFVRSCPGDAEALLPHLIRFATLQAGERLRLIQKDVLKQGWIDFDVAQRYDRLGTTPELALRVAQRADDLAALDPLTAPLAGWYRGAAEALLKRWDDRGQSPGAKAP